MFYLLALYHCYVRVCHARNHWMDFWALEEQGKFLVVGLEWLLNRDYVLFCKDDVCNNNTGISGYCVRIRVDLGLEVP